MIRKDLDFDGFTVSCDERGCQETAFIEVQDFRSAIYEAKQLGWMLRRMTENWRDTCPKCVKKVGGSS